MAWKQLRKPNTSVKGRNGFCLQYARSVFNVGPKYPTAWTAWTKSIQHRDRKFPKSVAFPIWFSHRRAGVNFGHVVIAIPGRGYYSSPYRKGTDHAVLKSIAEVERIYSAKLVGWSEDINGVRVIVNK